jgi:hypothetical protein
MTTIPLLWQALVPVAIWFTALLLSPSIRRGLHGIALSTPSHWLAWVQALRVGAIGGVMKGISGEIDSGYVLWIGIPDMLFGISALLIGWLLLRGNLDQRMLMFWNLLGFGLIFFPTFLIMPYWMSEPGFNFIFEYPMILAPGMVVATLLSLNLMQAWAAWNERNRERTTGAHPAT